MKELLDLYLSFFKMGAVTFGGGYTMLPILKRECVESKRWVSDEQVMDFYAVSQGLPGIIAVNVAVFIHKSSSATTCAAPRAESPPRSAASRPAS